MSTTNGTSIENERRIKKIQEERDAYREELAVARKTAKEFDEHFADDMRELESIKEENYSDVNLYNSVMEFQNTISGMKRKIDELFEKVNKDYGNRLKELDDEEGELKYRISQDLSENRMEG